jgi:hypothetical protein
MEEVDPADSPLKDRKVEKDEKGVKEGKEKKGATERHTEDEPDSDHDKKTRRPIPTNPRERYRVRAG